MTPHRTHRIRWDDAGATCTCGWTSTTYHSKYSDEAARIGAKAAVAKHTAHPDRKEDQ